MIGEGVVGEVMLPGLEIVTAGLLTLASGGGVQCTVPKAPVINVVPSTQAIQYDFSKPEADLTAQKSDTVSPYAPGVDTATRGLRYDQPEMKMEVSWGYMQYPGGATCFWYDTVNISVQLKPQIFIAKELSEGRCRDAVIEHENKHVKVDRAIVNSYVQNIGRSVQDAVNAAGAMGPYNADQIEPMQKKLVDHIKSAISMHELTLYKEMRAKQGQVDSLEEYNRVNGICRAEEKTKKKKR